MSQNITTNDATQKLVVSVEFNKIASIYQRNRNKNKLLNEGKPNINQGDKDRINEDMDTTE